MRTGLPVERWTSLPSAAGCRSRLTSEELATQIPHLTLAQVHAALAYYHANRGEMDAEMAAEEAEADRLEREHRESSEKA